MCYRRNLVRCLFTCLALSLLACSSSSSSPVTPADSDAGTDPSTDPGTDSTNRDDQTPPAKYGTVMLAQSKSPTDGSYTLTGATWFFDATASSSSTCTTEKIAGCDYYECTIAGATSTSPTYRSAGTVTVDGAGVNMTFAPSSKERTGYATQTSQGSTATFKPGQTIHIEAGGDVIGAFSYDLVAPAEVVLKTPSIDASRQVTIDFSKAVVVTWTGGSAGDVQAQLGSIHTGARSRQLSCNTAGSAGSLTFPAEGVAKLEHIDGKTVTGSISVSAQSQKTIRVDDASISLSAVASTFAGTLRAN